MKFNKQYCLVCLINVGAIAGTSDVDQKPDQCASNMGYESHFDDSIHVLSLNLNPCYQNPKMKEKDGCGMMKLGETSVDIKFQVKDGQHFSKLDLALAVHTSSLKGVAFSFSLADWANPCAIPDKSFLACPLNKGQNHIYSLRFAININYMLSLLIPSTETLDAVLTVEGTDLYTGATKKLGEVNKFYLAMMDTKDKVVKEGLVKQTHLTGETPCHDIARLSQVPTVFDESSPRISFLKLDRTSQEQSSAYFIVTETTKRRSFGVPELTISLHSSTGKSITVTSLDDTEKYPCGPPAAKTTCQFSTLKQLKSKRPKTDDRSIRRYRIDFSSVSDKIMSALPAGASVDAYNVTYTLQGGHTRAFGKITMPLSDLMSEVHLKPEAPSPEREPERKIKKKTSREPLWKYDLEDYTAEKLLAAVENSASNQNSLLMTLLVFLAYLAL